ncbi:hypothetical protein G3N55_02115 [Dissulfurirhabdus thermomarina]|uniref:Uncharacterized protein n=1 Tax=Dissulfurirhabdus thermomarina TaxID=1765737 RepID=A0A6N9TKQ0_DISTH|nr:hypothetical protein [Dissulfurirhabdus thermomarina]NDY41648.1 hypothetical protein [Dissulfurirhabdus thermomarina]NMX24340.1 hypothetical protein [Dissulfurirhabdus thermomarina]
MRLQRRRHLTFRRRAPAVAAALCACLFAAAPAAAGRYFRIADGACGVVTEERVTPCRACKCCKKCRKCRKVAMYLRNDHCIGRYRILLDGKVLGEGETDFHGPPKTLPLGNSRVTIGCEIQGDLSVTVR